MTLAAKPSPAFEVFAPDAYPERVPIHALSKILAAAQKLAAGPDHENDDVDESEDDGLDALFGLTGIRRGSASYSIVNSTPEKSLKNIRDAGKVVHRPETIGDREFMLKPIQILSEISKSIGSPICFREPGKDGQTLVTFNAATFSHLSDKLLVKGDTTILGEVIRVGGATGKKCGMRIDGRKRLLICTVQKQETARKLGQRLYERVSAEGTAHWLKTTWSVYRFSIRDIRQAKRAKPAEIISGLRNAGGSDWDEIDDPLNFLGETAG